MKQNKDIIVTTSSGVDGRRVIRYIKPIAIHIVAGTNVFSDFMAGITDVFGGRSNTYQNQLKSLYNEAINRIKSAAIEVGANCIIGLNIDMDEVAGKGKSMFMLTAVGTAVIIEKEPDEKHESLKQDDIQNSISSETLALLRRKRKIIESSNAGTLELDEEIWNFITTNQVIEVFPFLLKKLQEAIIASSINKGVGEKFMNHLLGFIDGLPENKKLDILYNTLQSEKEKVIIEKLCQIIEKLTLFEFNRVMSLLKSNSFEHQKIALQLALYDKPTYTQEDINMLKSLQEAIKATFVEKGQKTMKKQLLSSKEKEAWICECGKTNDINTHCGGCGNDIYGFKSDEIKPSAVEEYLDEKMQMIKEFLK